MYSKELVFVYGTLRKNASNAHRMSAARFLFSATLQGSLYRIDWYPGLILEEGGGEVIGEVFEVSTGVLEALDRYEGMEYRRVQIEVINPEKGKTLVWVYEYTQTTKNLQRIASGDWLEVEKGMGRD